jgi:hypothetical protein
VTGQRPGRPRPRWGLRTLGFLTLAAASILTSNVMYARDDASLVLLTFAGTVIGLVGAAVCSLRGLLAMHWSRPRGR